MCTMAARINKCLSIISLGKISTKTKNKLSIPVAAKENIKPTLIVHGDQDTTVLLNEGLQLHEWIANSELQIIKSADHVFNTSHPFNKKEGFSSN